MKKLIVFFVWLMPAVLSAQIEWFKADSGSFIFGFGAFKSEKIVGTPLVFKNTKLEQSKSKIRPTAHFQFFVPISETPLFVEYVSNFSPIDLNSDFFFGLRGKSVSFGLGLQTFSQRTRNKSSISAKSEFGTWETYNWFSSKISFQDENYVARISMGAPIGEFGYNFRTTLAIKITRAPLFFGMDYEKQKVRPVFLVKASGLYLQLSSDDVLLARPF